MKIFTKSVLVAIAMMAGVTTANAQYTNPEEWVELDASWWHQWADPEDQSQCTKAAQIVGEVSPSWDLNTAIGPGTIILGDGNVSYNVFADISDYEKVIIYGEYTGDQDGNKLDPSEVKEGMRVMCNRIVHEGDWKQFSVNFSPASKYWDADLEAIVIPVEDFKTTTLSSNGDGNGKERVDDFVHLHCLKNAWGGQFGISVSAIYVWKTVDPAGIKTVKANVEDGAYYNLAGQKVANPEKGVFIHNGKKIVKK